MSVLREVLATRDLQDLPDRQVQRQQKLDLQDQLVLRVQPVRRVNLQVYISTTLVPILPRCLLVGSCDGITRRKLILPKSM